MSNMTTKIIILGKPVMDCQIWWPPILKQRLKSEIMRINKDEFFREATLRICSSLELNTAFGRAFEYMRKFFPLDYMSLHILDKNLGATRLIAFATVKNVKPEEILPLPEGIWEWMKGLRHPFTLTTSSIQDEPIRIFASLIKLHGYSDLTLPLRIEDNLIGFLVFRARSDDKYTAEHIDLLATVAEPFAIALNNALAHESEVKLREMLIDDNRFLSRELLPHVENNVVGGNSGLSNVMNMVQQVALRSSTLLLLGETGTGKEVIANAIHFASKRKDGPFIKVNCGAIPENLIDSELFGHEKGAFTGAVNAKRGRFERANGGTIFLDEIGELPLQAQVRLLRVLQNREIERVGGEKPVAVDVRVIAATHRNLESMVADKSFREDLWFRLNVFPIMVPPLRQRKEDIPALAKHFVISKSRELGIAPEPEIAPGALERLRNYDWPGNVRELENLVERELILRQDGPLTFASLFPQKKNTRIKDPTSADEELPTSLDRVIAMHIISVLESTGGKIHGPEGAAEILEINPSTLRARMRKLGIKFGRTV